MQFLFDDEILPRVTSMLRKTGDRDIVYLISPYLKLNDRVRQAVETAANARAEVVFITRRNVPDRPDDDIRWLLDRKVSVYELEHLHAKIYWCKSEALVTSMNLHDSSDRSSREIGVLFDELDRIDQIRVTIESWKASAIELKPSQLGVRPASPATSAPRRDPQRIAASAAVTSSKGFCIRCGKPKTYNKEYPLCDDCWPKWAQYKNEQYPEKHCHRCGKPSDVTYRLPLCGSCFSRTTK